MAVALQYGAPSPTTALEESDRDVLGTRSISGPMEEPQSNCSENTAQKKQRESEEPLRSNDIDDCRQVQQSCSNQKSNISSEGSTASDLSHSSDNDTKNYSTEGSSDKQRQQKGKQQSANLLGKELGIATWVKKQKSTILKSKRHKHKSDPLEGVIRLDKPMLLCQEIYGKFIGNHQTSVLSKERAIELWKEDVQQHMKDGGVDGDDPFLEDQDGIFAQFDEAGKMYDAVVKPSATANATRENVVDEPLECDMNITDNEQNNEGKGGSPGPPLHSGEQPPPQTSVSRVDESRPASDGNNDDDTKQHHDPEVLDERCSQTGSIVDEGVEEQDESLIGYWKWENTWKVHQMKMQVAKGTDLALHCVMAIIVNQVRYERNAIAMSV